MSDIKNFTFAPAGSASTGLELRVIDRNGEPWFVAKDVCEALGHTNTTVAMVRIEAEDQAKQSLGEPPRVTNLVNEAGLYSLILRSNKPEARAFKKWVTSEVLPTIRKTGGYMAPSVALTTDSPTHSVPTNDNAPAGKALGGVRTAHSGPGRRREG